MLPDIMLLQIHLFDVNKHATKMGSVRHHVLYPAKPLRSLLKIQLSITFLEVECLGSMFIV